MKNWVIYERVTTPADKTLKTRVVLPCYNESSRVADSVDKILAWSKKNLSNQQFEFEWLWVNDGSRDDTHEQLLKHTARLPGARVVSYSVNRGKGFACRSGILDEGSQPDFIFFTDADLAIPLDHLLEVLRLYRAQQGGFDVVLGNRNPEDRVIHENIFRNLMSRVFRTWVRWRVKLPFSDTQCGFKGFKTDVARQIFAPLRRYGFSFDIELLMRSQSRGFKVIEVPVRCDNKGLSSVRVFRDSFKMLMELEALHDERRRLPGVKF